ncbi:Variant-specific surface protein [Giardia duodenalis]|uniref:Variant-specific surface protein n=1 Tax=Giardia intestinalis TaxID=5741 RepID=V6TRZ4_GIAIN|nr:Variant-specific surface protein [Giardia intestinalis]
MLLAICFAAGALAAACSDSQTNCAEGQCDTVGGTEICTQCKQSFVPINGACVEAAANNDKCKDTDGNADADQTCKVCLLQTFMYKGGCYEGSNEIGQIICGTIGSDAGKCQSCKAANGFFRNPEAANNVDSCISCGDTTGVTVGNGDSAKTYKGVNGCKTCTFSDPATTATCTECATGFLHTPTGSTSCVAECPKGYFGHTASNTQKKTCQSCTTASGLTPDVAGIEGCTSCTYIGGDSGTLTCSECENGKKPSLDGLHCYDCTVGNCAFCNSEGACQKCISGYILDGAACTQQTCSTPDCKTCNNPKAPSEACTACVSTHYLTPTGQCISDCTALSGYYGDTDKTCKRCGVANCETCNEQGKCSVCTDGFYGDSCSKCDSSCKNCSGSTASDCTACPAGKALTYGSDGTKGTCGNGCTTGTGNGAYKTCGLTVEGTAYCSECATPTEYPQNGICVSKTARITDGCKDGTVAGGVCKSCSDGFFLMEGGCYETGKYPGKSVCTSAPTGGTCTSLASGYYLNSGTLVTCGTGCAECTNSDSCTTCADGYVKLNNAQTCTKCNAGCATFTGTASTCSTCADGYYLSNSKCITCDKSDGSITGVSGCLSCAAPSGSTGPVLCYLMKDSTAGGSDPNLSTGVIAGISVAAVVVVGALIGFLCWWFLCKTRRAGVSSSTTTLIHSKSA